MTADWGREVCDALARLRPSVGPGLKMSQTPQGTVYSLAERSERRTEATPMPFDIRTVASGETISLEAWMPADTTTVVRRNGYYVAPPSTLSGGTEGWITFWTGLSPESTYYVIRRIQAIGGGLAAWPPNVGNEWILDVVENPSAAAPPEIMTDELIAVCVDGKVAQITRGAFSTYAYPPDEIMEPAKGSKSLQYFDNGEIGFYGFRDPATISAADGIASVVCDLTLRHQGNVEDSTLVNYMSFQDLVDYIIGAMPPYPEQDLDPYDLFVNHPCPVPPDGKIVVFDPCGGNTGTGGWISKAYWESGDGTATCYGSGIADENQTEKINLTGSTLTVPGEDTLNWGTKILDFGWKANDALQHLSADFGIRNLFDPSGILAVDWDERVLLDSSEIGSVGWSERLLTRDSGSYAVDWQNSILYDAAEDPAVSWVSRTLSGEWSVAAAGSIDTPAFKYGGVTYAPETLSIVTGVTVDPVTHAATLTTVNKTVLVAQP